MSEKNEKFYKIVIKPDSHINTKSNPDGSVAALQFTNDKNELNGPVDIIEVDESELIQKECITIKEGCTLKEIVFQDILAPIARELLYEGLMIGFDKLSVQFKEKTLPELKNKVITFKYDMNVIASGLIDGLSGKEIKAVQLLNEHGTENIQDRQYQETKTIRTKKEVENLIKAMQYSASILVASVKMLNNTIIMDDGADPEQKQIIQETIQVLSSTEVIQRIELLLEEKNHNLLNPADIAMLSAFKDGYFIVENRKIPITNYLP